MDCGKYIRRKPPIRPNQVPAGTLPEDARGERGARSLFVHRQTVGHGVVVARREEMAVPSELADRGYVTCAELPASRCYQLDVKKLGWKAAREGGVGQHARARLPRNAAPMVPKLSPPSALARRAQLRYTAVFDPHQGDRSEPRPDLPRLLQRDEKNWLRARLVPTRTAKLAGVQGPPEGHSVRPRDDRALAPRHVFIVAPLKDSNFKHDSVDRIAAAAKPIFKLHGHEDRLKVTHPDCPHDFPNESREEAYKLFDAVLKAK